MKRGGDVRGTVRPDDAPDPEPMKDLATGPIKLRDGDEETDVVRVVLREYAHDLARCRP
jgi:hypothetical protein